MNQLTYRIYTLSPSGKQLLVEEKKNYTTDDIIVNEIENDPSRKRSPYPVRWTKALPLQCGFQIGASIYRTDKRTGFGLWLKEIEPAEGDLGFSWEWFDLPLLSKCLPKQEKQVFKKLQGGAEVKVSFLTVGDYEEISAIEFLTDVTLRYIDSMNKEEESHHMFIECGSVLQLEPNQIPDPEPHAGLG